ncbi:hypothetical protein JKF63_02999 [Porcisia hertigi]|uniref:Uncharacterized protein n=1 Tax=Porcisia hertigi TaxID=2761500 RepID=A0A836L4P8_9TRYP|nr:hypothetical protein JKF63_02999 [Porcisia hertigi]
MRWSVDLSPDGILPGSLCVTHDAVWWVSASGVLYTWRADESDGEVTKPVSVAQLDRRVKAFAVSPDASRIVAVSSTYMVVLQIERTESPGFLCSDGDDSLGEVTGDALMITAEEVVRVACTVSDVRSAVFNSDATLVAVCTDSALVLLSNILGAATEYDILGTKPQATSFNCTRLSASTQGCSLACFTGVQQLLIVDDVNHLVLLQCDTAGEHGNNHNVYTGTHATGTSSASQPAVTLELMVDGHICTRTSRVTSLSSSHSGVYGESVVVLGLFNGTVQVLHGRTLQVLRTWSVQDAVSAALFRSLDAETATGSRLRRRPLQSAASDRLGIPNVVGPTEVTPAAAILDVCVGTCLITVCTSRGVVYYNKFTFQLESAYTQIWTTTPSDIENATAPAEASFLSSVEMRGGSNGLWAYINVFEGVLFFFPSDLDTRHTLEARSTEAGIATEDIVHARTPLPAAWLGRVSRTRDATSETNKMIALNAARSTQKLSFSSPAPPRKTVKGSGYCDAPWSVQQERRRKAKAIAAHDRKAQAFGAVSALAVKSRSALRFEYNFAAIFGTEQTGLTRVEAATSALCGLHARAVTGATFSSAGDALISVGGDGRIQHLHFPIARVKGAGGLAGRVLGGHSVAITAVDPNLSRQHPLVLSAGADGCIRVWAPGVRDTPIAECSVNCGSGRGARASLVNPIVAGQFFYLDKFVMSCAADTLELRRYAGDIPTSSGGADDLDNALSGAPVFKFSVGNGHSITAATAVNHFASNLVFLATSEKEVQLLDVATNTVLWGERTTHSRGIYRVATDRTNRYGPADASNSAAAHLFMSASLDSTAALWDVRVAKPVQLFTQHSNTGSPSLALEFAPGIGAVAVASQDNAVYMYDLRGGGTAIAVDVLRGFDSHVTSFAWHPLRPVLAAGLANGDVHILHHAP